MTIVVDTSVAIKWFINEEGSALAEKILTDIATSEVTAIASDLFFYEAGNVFLSKKQPGNRVEEIMSQLSSLGIITKSIFPSLFIPSYEIAQNYAISFYDASYIMIAKEEACPFITADKKLYDKTKKDFPNIQLL